MSQQPFWPDTGHLAAITRRLAVAPPLVPLTECDRLRGELAAIQRGEAFLLQGGDCAEQLGTPAEVVLGTLETLSRMAGTLSAALSLPVVMAGRIAGQYAKPRSKPIETRDGVTLPVYRGDAVNGWAFTEDDRRPDAGRLLRVYTESAATLRLLGPGFYASHEGLLLPYERALVRCDPATGRRYASSGHLLWIGERTRDLDGPHVAFFAGLANPIGVKIGPATTADTLLALIDRLDPDREPGRLTFITRMGARLIRERLPELAGKVAAAGERVVWVCDPMHGNGFVSPNGHKTRSYADVLDEAIGFAQVLRSVGVHPGGLHVELTGEDVTECVGAGLDYDDLDRRYESRCDPRLNRAQALRLAAEFGSVPSVVAGHGV
jgi:3-deoxy-D-arabino-heptulosonate 7-phosphate (DAHP) synthase class II